jgi:hypothetical protein
VDRSVAFFFVLSTDNVDPQFDNTAVANGLFSLPDVALSVANILRSVDGRIPVFIQRSLRSNSKFSSPFPDRSSQNSLCWIGRSHNLRSTSHLIPALIAF